MDARAHDLTILTAVAEDSEKNLTHLLTFGLLGCDAAALARQLPAMVAALRFVEDHGEATERALHHVEHHGPSLAAAWEALASLRSGK